MLHYHSTAAADSTIRRVAAKELLNRISRLEDPEFPDPAMLLMSNSAEVAVVDGTVRVAGPVGSGVIVPPEPVPKMVI
jgi:hypothetical protein